MRDQFAGQYLDESSLVNPFQIFLYHFGLQWGSLATTKYPKQKLPLHRLTF